MRWGGMRGMARCPAHDDITPSLSIRITDEGDILLHCFAGCDIMDICSAVGLTVAELYADKEGYYRPPGQPPRFVTERKPDPHLRPTRL